MLYSFRTSRDGVAVQALKIVRPGQPDAAALMVYLFLAWTDVPGQFLCNWQNQRTAPLQLHRPYSRSRNPEGHRAHDVLTVAATVQDSCQVVGRRAGGAVKLLRLATELPTHILLV